MKNHIKVNGELLQTNKKWSALKQSQRDWIYELTRKSHRAYIDERNRTPRKRYKDIIIDAVYEKIKERGIWIPYDEFHSKVSAYIDRLNRRI